MPSERHIGPGLSAYLSGRSSEAERAEVEGHLASCAACAEERDLLAAGRTLVPALAPFEPRAGFATMVALNARDARKTVFGPWLRWALGGAAVAGVAAAALSLSVRKPPAEPDGAVVLAQRLELYEDLSVVQNQDALEDLDVVEVLHTLQPEGKP